MNGAKTLKLLQDRLIPAVHVIINRKPVPFLIDTGFNGNFRVDSETLDELKAAGCVSAKEASHIMLKVDGRYYETSVFVSYETPGAI